MENRNYRIVVILLSIIIILLLITKSCNSTDTNKRYEKMKKELLSKEKSIDSISRERIFLVDSIKILTRKSRQDSLRYSNNISRFQDRIVYIYKNVGTIPKGTDEINKYFSMRYEAPDSNINLGPFWSDTIVSELMVKDVMTAIIPLKDSIITYKDSIISNVTDNLTNTKSILEITEKERHEREIMSLMAKDNISNLEKRLKRSKGISKIGYYLIPVGVILGGFIGYKLIK